MQTKFLQKNHVLHQAGIATGTASPNSADSRREGG